MPAEHDGLQPSRVGHSWDGDYENREYSPVYEPLWRMLETFLVERPETRRRSWETWPTAVS